MLKLWKAFSILIVVLAWTIAVWVTVFRPFQQVRELKTVVWRTDYVGAPTSVSRAFVRYLESTDLWDPYLRGWRDLYLARNYRRLGRMEDAREAYERAIGGKVPGDVLVEAGVFDIQMGRVEEGEEKLLRAAAYSGGLLDQIEDPGWRSYIQEKLYADGMVGKARQ